MSTLNRVVTLLLLMWLPITLATAGGLRICPSHRMSVTIADHCHKSHHTMNAMAHAVPTLIGADTQDLTAKIRQVAHGYMPMGATGMAEMSDMNMPLPANILPMMTGTGPFGALEMGGMFTVLKVREGLAAGDYQDPGWYQHPKGTVAYLVEDEFTVPVHRHEK